MSSFQKRLKEAQEQAGIRQHGSVEAFNKAKKQDERIGEFLKFLGRCITVAIYLALFFLASGLLYFLWNWTAPMLHAQQIPFEAACGVVGMVLVLRFILR